MDDDRYHGSYPFGYDAPVGLTVSAFDSRYRSDDSWPPAFAGDASPKGSTLVGPGSGVFVVVILLVVLCRVFYLAFFGWAILACPRVDGCLMGL